MSEMLKRRNRLTALTAMFSLLGILLLGNTCTASADGGADSPSPAYNIVLLIDRSGSMNRTDPQRLALDAAKMFVHSFYAGTMRKQADGQNQSASKIGVIAFSEFADTVTPLVEVSSQKQASAVADRIDDIIYDPPDTGATDLGHAVWTATTLFQENDDNTPRKNVIIL